MSESFEHGDAWIKQRADEHRQQLLCTIERIEEIQREFSAKLMEQKEAIVKIEDLAQARSSLVNDLEDASKEVDKAMAHAWWFRFFVVCLITGITKKEFFSRFPR